MSAKTNVLVKSLCWLAAALYLTGCFVVPVPHWSQQSPRLSGRVVDASNGKPIVGATVQVTNRSETHGELYAGATAKTGANGEFRLGARYNLHFVYYANASWHLSLPLGSYWTGELRVAHANYKPMCFTEPDEVRDHRSPVFVGELRLLPMTPTP
jgi:5-hydroxyisourate hydrolase-like protein (transthyretin family)